MLYWFVIIYLIPCCEIKITASTIVRQWIGLTIRRKRFCKNNLIQYLRQSSDRFVSIFSGDRQAKDPLYVIPSDEFRLNSIVSIGQPICFNALTFGGRCVNISVTGGWQSTAGIISALCSTLTNTLFGIISWQSFSFQIRQNMKIAILIHAFYSTRN